MSTHGHESRVEAEFEFQKVVAAVQAHVDGLIHMGEDRFVKPAGTHDGVLDTTEIKEATKRLKKVLEIN